MKTDNHKDRLLEDLDLVYREAPIGLCQFDTDLRFVHINGWLAAMNGVSIEKHLGRRIGEVLPDVAAGVESPAPKQLLGARKTGVDFGRCGNGSVDGKHA